MDRNCFFYLKFWKVPNWGGWRMGRGQGNLKRLPSGSADMGQDQSLKVWTETCAFWTETDLSCKAPSETYRSPMKNQWPPTVLKIKSWLPKMVLAQAFFFHLTFLTLCLIFCTSAALIFSTSSMFCSSLPQGLCTCYFLCPGVSFSLTPIITYSSFRLND